MAPAAKEEKGEVRKRKSAGSATAKEISSSPTSGPKVSKTSLYKEISKLEETQSVERTPEQDAQLNADTVKDLKRIVKEIQDLKLKKGNQATSEISELRMKANLHFLTLKKLNRLDKLRVRASRDATHNAKSRVDTLHQQLQNLLYEVLHLQKEVTKCQQFKSKDEEIDLVPVEEFYREAPAEVAKAEETQEDGHQQRLARLEFENLQRKEMNSAFRELEAARDALEGQIKKKRENLSSLEPQLKNILETSKPVQAYLKMPLTEEHEQLGMTKHLPRPLFVLYTQCKYYGQACDKDIAVTIKGDADEARTFNAGSANKEDDGDDDEATAEDAGEEEDSGSKKKRAAAGAKKGESKQEERLRRAIARHPLQIEVKLSLAEEDAVTLLFCFLPALQVVGVTTVLSLGKENSKSVGSGSREGLQPFSLFAHLLEEDDAGVQSPNPASAHMLRQMGIKRLSQESLTETGCLYRWVQTLGGMTFPKEDAIAAEESDKNDSGDSVPRADVDNETSESQVQHIINSLKRRVTNRVALQTQLAHLHRAKHVSVEPSVPESLRSLFPSRTVSKVRNWTSVDWEQYTKLGVTQHLVRGRAVDGHDLFYRLQVNREPATLIALIAVKPDYPRRSPVFCLNLHWNGEHNVHNSEHIRDLESLVNTDFYDLPDKQRGQVLSLQLQRLLSSLDVLLEAWNAAQADDGAGNKVDFQKEKIFIHAVRGRTRSLPLRYNTLLQIYSQR